MRNNVGETLVDSINRSIFAAASFIPNLIVGLIILLIGILLGSIVRNLIISILNTVKLENQLKRYGIPEGRKGFSWVNIFGEITRWFVIILFLIPTADVWNLPQIITMLNAFLLYLPNVIVAVIMALVGFALARIAHDLILASAHGVSPDTAQMIATVARWAIVVFIALAVLTQLGVASDLIRILFTGFVAMVAIAGGIAFGLGGQDTAKRILDTLRSGFNKPSK